MVSVLEGGYSDRALTSASMAHFVGLTDLPPAGTDSEVERVKGWWSLESLVEVCIILPLPLLCVEDEESFVRYNL